jgi:hypothetical protein
MNNDDDIDQGNSRTTYVAAVKSGLNPSNRLGNHRHGFVANTPIRVDEKKCTAVLMAAKKAGRLGITAKEAQKILVEMGLCSEGNNTGGGHILYILTSRGLVSYEKIGRAYRYYVKQSQPD